MVFYPSKKCSLKGATKNWNFLTFQILFTKEKKQFLPEFSDADGCGPPALASRQPYNFHPSFETHKNCLLQM